MARAVAITLCVLGMLATTVQAVPVMPNPNGLTAYYLFDEASGSTVLDGKGTVGNNGTMVGDTIARVTATPFTYTGNTAMSFDAGTTAATDDDYVRIQLATTTLNFNRNGAFSISAWFKTTSSGTLVSRATGSPQYQVLIRASTANPNPYCLQASVGGIGPYTDTMYNDGIWHNVVISYSGTTGKMYVDGVDSLTVSPGSTSNIAVDTLIGARRNSVNAGSAGAFTGLIDEVAFFNYALSADEAGWLASNSLASVPEPATLCLLALGGLLAARRRR